MKPPEVAGGGVPAVTVRILGSFVERGAPVLSEERRLKLVIERLERELDTMSERRHVSERDRLMRPVYETLLRRNRLALEALLAVPDEPANRRFAWPGAHRGRRPPTSGSARAA